MNLMQRRYLKCNKLFTGFDKYLGDKMKYFCSNCSTEFESTVAECPNCGETYDIVSDENESEEQNEVDTHRGLQ